jgi:hypothetical protein
MKTSVQTSEALTFQKTKATVPALRNSGLAAQFASLGANVPVCDAQPTFAAYLRDL